MHIKKNDNVIILAGKDKGKTGKIEKVLPKINKVIIAGLNTVKKHQKATKNGTKGQMIDKAMPIHASNVKLVSDTKKSEPKKVEAKKVKAEKK